MKILVLASEALDAATVRSTLGRDREAEDAEVMVVAPAVNESPLAFWMSDSDEAIADARNAAHETASTISAESGAHVMTRTGESDPLLALQDALVTFPADKVYVFARQGDEARYREDDLLERIQSELDVPVQQVALAPRG